MNTKINPDYSYRTDESMVMAVVTKRKMSFKKEIKRHIKEINKLLYELPESESEINDLVNWVSRCVEVRKKFKIK